MRRVARRECCIDATLVVVRFGWLFLVLVIVACNRSEAGDGEPSTDDPADSSGGTTSDASEDGDEE